MKSMTRFSLFAVLLALVIGTVACGPTYVQPVAYQPQYEYNPGYNPNNVVADAILTAAIVNGVSGYYGPNRVFYPQAMYGGVPGYYVGGVFHTSGANHTTIVNNYNTGRMEFQRNPAQYAQRNPSMVTKPAYTGQSGSGMGRQSSGQSVQTPVQQRPSYGSGGSMGRGPQAASVQQQRPSYGSGGSMGRSVSSPSPSYSAPASRPSYGSSSGSMGRSSSSSSSSSGSSRRR